jgi:hypothetical protein
MERNSTDGTLAGEPIGQLHAILREMILAGGEDGSVRVTLSLNHDDGACLVRALMRIEAELLLHDAEHVNLTGSPRTAQQRRADAFVALALRAMDSQRT